MRRETAYNEIFDAQQYYRLLLDSMSQPGKIVALYELDVQPPLGLNKASTLVALSLLNADVSFCCIHANKTDITSYLLLNTSATPIDVDKADFIFSDGANSGDDIQVAKTGTLPYPEEGSTLVIDVKSISENPTKEGLEITVSGPGVLMQKSFFVEGLNEQILVKLAAANSEFPLGIDVILTDVKNNVVCIPRSNKILWKNKSSL